MNEREKTAQDRADVVAVVAHLARLMRRQDHDFDMRFAAAAPLISAMCIGLGFDDAEIAMEALDLAARMEVRQ